MKLDKLDYALIDRRDLEPLCVQIIQQKGKSCDKYANQIWHQDLRNLSGKKILELAVLTKERGKIKRVLKSKIHNLIIRSIKRDFIDQSQVEDRIKQELDWT